MATDYARLKDALNEIDYPADKEQLLAQATLNDADADTMKALRSIQPVSYANLADVKAATPMTTGQSDSDKAQQNRQNTKDGLAESMTETPNNPIVEELGENRGS